MIQGGQIGPRGIKSLDLGSAVVGDQTNDDAGVRAHLDARRVLQVGHVANIPRVGGKNHSNLHRVF